MIKIFDLIDMVFTRMKEKITDRCPNIGMWKNTTPLIFPFTELKVLDNGIVALDLEEGENAVNSNIEIAVYSQDGLSDVNEIMQLVNQEMHRMGYSRTGPYYFETAPTPGIDYVCYRFNRIIGVGEEL